MHELAKRIDCARKSKQPIGGGGRCNQEGRLHGNHQGFILKMNSGHKP